MTRNILLSLLFIPLVSGTQPPRLDTVSKFKHPSEVLLDSIKMRDNQNNRTNKRKTEEWLESAIKVDSVSKLKKPNG